MIAALPRPLLGRGVRALLRRRLRRGLAALRIDGQDRLAALSAQGPLLLCANHVSFYDGLVVEWLSRGLRETRVWMRADQLRAAPLLRWAGAFGVEDDPRDRALALRWSARFLDRPGRGLWIFPQGALRPQWQRPLGFQRGAALIARASGALAVPVSLQYELSEREQPEAWVQIGDPIEAALLEETPSLLESAVTRGLDQLAERIASGALPESPWPAPARLGEGLFTRALAAVLRP